MSVSFKDFPELEHLEGSVEKIVLDRKNNRINIHIRTKYLADLEEIKTVISDYLELNIPLDFTFSYDRAVLEPELIIKLLKDKSRFDSCSACLKESDILIDNKTIRLEFSAEEFMNKFLDTGGDKELALIAKRITGDSFNIECQAKNTDLNRHLQSLNEEENNFIDTQDRIIAAKPKKNTAPETDIPFSYGKEIKDDIIKIKDITVEHDRPAIEGEMFDITDFKTRNGKYGIKFYVDDGTSALRCLTFLSPEKYKGLRKYFKDGAGIRCKGNRSYDDRFEHGYILILNSFEGITRNPRPDLARKKRVELHMYTQMSQVDGFVDIKQLMDRLTYWGHKAVGITDKSVVQAYPDFYEISMKRGIKPLFGMEAYILENEIRILSDGRYADNFNTFVVFDIETTGLSKYKDNVTEIGAVKIENGKITDHFDELINPKMPISEFITDLTGITNEMVVDKDPIEKVLPRFFEFIGNAVLVAHNAEFDIGFLREKAFQLNLPFQYAYIDTLALARALFPENKKHTLDKLAKDLRVPLLNHHRADEDAEATAKIFLEMLYLLHSRDVALDKNINSLKTDWPKSRNKGYNALLYVKNKIGLKNLYTLVSISSLKYYFMRGGILKKDLKKYREGLLLGSGNPHGRLFQAVSEHRSNQDLVKIAEEYDFLEIQPDSVWESEIERGKLPPKEDFKKINKKIYEIGKKTEIPVVATGDVRYLDKKDMEFRNIILEGQLGRKPDEPETVPGKYLRTTDEMLEEFSYLGKTAAEEVVVENTNAIADVLGDIRPVPEGKFPPIIEGSDEELKEICYKNAKKIYGDPLPDIVDQRLNKELTSIINNGYAVLYIIARKLVLRSNKDGYLVGSRGSVGSSLAATMAGITEVNPLKAHYICPNSKCKHSIFIDDEYTGSGIDLDDKICPKCGTKMKKEGHNIPFEVFLGFEGDKEPDIDLNFAGEYQPVCHKYTEELFGEGKVFRAGTIGAIKDNTAYGYIKKYQEKHEIQLDPANIARLQRGMTGVKRTSGQHPGGIMIVPKDKDITDFTPVQHPADDNNTDIITTHFTYQSIQENILKLDLLGHDVPSIIKMLQDLTGVDPNDVPMDDRETMEIFSGTESLNFISDDHNLTIGTLGIPEFGTGFVRQMLEDTKPTTFSELVRISGLSHGTDVWLNNAQDLIKEGIIELKDAICTRDDIMLYLIDRGLKEQEAFTIMERVRKNRFVGDPKYEQYLQDMKAHDVPDWYIKSCEKIQYLFPKAHAVAYVLMSYRIAYFKVHYPEEFYCTYFTTKIQDYPGDLISSGLNAIRAAMEDIRIAGKDASPKDKSTYQVLEVAEEMYLRGIKASPIRLGISDGMNFKVLEKGSIQPPLRALDGVSDAHAQELDDEYKKQPFISIEDMKKRTCVNKTAIESLKEHGALDGMQETDQISFL